jgi:uracil-DNA glycosylase
LLWEEAATYHEVKNLLKEFQRQYGKPQRISEVHIDDVNGVWTALPKGKPIPVMTVFHPASLRYRDNEDMATLDEDVAAHWGR